MSGIKGDRCENPIENPVGLEADFSGVLCDGRWKGANGIGRFSSEVLSGIPGAWVFDRGKPLFLSPADPFWIECQIARYHPRVYFTPGFNPPLTTRCPFVVTVHDMIHLKIPEERSLVKQVYYEAILKPPQTRAERVLTVSEFSRLTILEWSGLEPERVVVLGCGVGSFSPKGSRWDPGYPYCLYVGNHKGHKNVEFLLTAFSRTNANSSFRLVLTGHTALTLQKFVHQHRIEDRTVFLGQVGESDLPALYRGAKALVFPSRYDGFGLPVLEAMACKVPVIAARIPPYRRDCGDSVHFLSLEDLEAWTATLDQMVEDGLFGKERVQAAFL